MHSNLRRANRTIIGEDGLASATLKKVSLGTGYKKETKGKRSFEECEYERYEFYFEVQGVTGDYLDVKLYTGTVINDEPVRTLGKGRGKAEKTLYNRFTTLCLSLGLIKEKELQTINNAQLQKLEDDLNDLKNTSVKVKIEKNEDGYYQIDPASVKITNKNIEEQKK